MAKTIQTICVTEIGDKENTTLIINKSDFDEKKYKISRRPLAKEEPSEEEKAAEAKAAEEAAAAEKTRREALTAEERDAEDKAIAKAAKKADK